MTDPPESSPPTYLHDLLPFHHAASEDMEMRSDNSIKQLKELNGSGDAMYLLIRIIITYIY